MAFQAFKPIIIRISLVIFANLFCNFYLLEYESAISPSTKIYPKCILTYTFGVKFTKKSVHGYDSHVEMK